MTLMRRLSALVVMAFLIVLTPSPSAAATITFTSATPTSPVAAGTPVSHTFTAAGDTAINFSLTTGALPAGVALSSLGVLSGTPFMTGTFNFTVRATGTPSGDYAEQPVRIVVQAPAITLTSAAPPSPVTAWQPFTHTFTATGGTAPHHFLLTSGGLPVGLALSSAGILSGTPSLPGSYTFVLKAADDNNFESAAYSVTIVVQAPTVTVNSPPVPATIYRHQPFTHTFTAAGGTAPHHFVMISGATPAGLSVSSPGVLSGTPIGAGSYSFAVKAVDHHGFESEPYVVNLVVAEPATAFTSSDAPDGTVGTPYSFTFAASGDSNIQFSIAAGSLPAGLTLAPTGVLSGTPSAAGSHTFTIKATGTATSATREVTVVIASAGGPILPVTGADVTLIVAVACGVLVVGGLLLLLARKRRRPADNP